ncbi:MAG: TetR/AcrR family transcriptional regulator [Clostridia bacterium]|nr:TetR/AcrR family transcriptional regulator [Clostridia bacterium]
MRIVKEYDERRNEIIDTAKKLFITKGYNKSSVNDILNEIGIAKGTFYYYFASKEEVLDAIIYQTTDIIVSRLEAICEDQTMSCDEKLLTAFEALNVEEQGGTELLNEIHKPENAMMHQKSLTSMVILLTPLFQKIIESGIEAGEYKCEYPKEYMQLFLSSSFTLLDDGIFSNNEIEKPKLLKAMITMLESMLHVEAGHFLHAYQTFRQN